MALRSRNIAVHTASRPAWNQNPAVVSTVQKSAIVAHVQSVPIAKPVSVAPPPKSVLKPALKHSGKIARGGKDKHVTIKALVDTESPCSSLHVTAHNTQRFMAPGAHNHAHAMDLDMSHAHTQSICEDEHALMPNPVVRDEPATASSHRAVGPTDADPMLLSEYAEEIFEYMKLMETKTTPNPNYMTNQPHLTWEMRSLLVDWLHSLHTRLHLLPETLFLAVNLMDRFMSLKQGVGRDKFQLVGLTCLQVACKYEEVMVPSVAVLVHMVQGGYSAEEVLKAERFVLGMIGFGVGYNGPVPFLKRVLAVDARGVGEDRDAAREVSKVSLLARYFCEVVLLDPAFVGAVPSMVATAAVFLGRKMLEVGSWVSLNLVPHSASSKVKVSCILDTTT
ncbi:cyclin-like protein, partial [Chytriomyces sp. MP71]